ncbi:hypothetical protein Unana1_00854 [Umbelopsis nana]
MDAINSSLDDVIKKGRQEKKQHKQQHMQQQTPPAKRSQGINKRPGPIRNSSSSRGSAFRKSPIQERRDMNSPWKHDLYEQASSQGTRSSPASITARLGGTSSNSVKVENLHYEVTEADVNVLGPCKAKLQFDRSGRSNGVANVKFDNVGDAQTAFKKYNNVELDGQPMKISLVESAVAGGDRAQGILGRIGGQSIMSRVGISHNTNQRGGGRRPNRGGQKGDQRRKVRSENDLDKEMDSYMSTPDDSAMTLD